MKLPAFLHLRRPARGLQGRMPPWRAVLLGALAFVIAFVLGALLAFPTASLRQKLLDSLQQKGVDAELQSLTLSPLLALRGEQLTLRPTDTSLPPLTVSRFTVRPLWWSLLTAEPGVQIDAELLQGTLQGTVHRGGRLQGEASGWHLTLPLKDGMATVTGTLASGSLQRAANTGKGAEQTLSLAFGELLVQSPLLGGTAGRPLNLGRLRLDGNGRGQAFTISRLESDGGDVTLSGSGSLLLGRTLESSRLNLNLTLRPAASLPGEIRGLLGLLGSPRGDGSYPLMLSGTLAAPRLQGAGSQAPGAISVESGQDDASVAEAPTADTIGNKRSRSTKSNSDDDD
jgi:type II secretion system protein N